LFEKILVCLDGSELAEQVLPYAEEQAKRFGSKVILLRVVPVASTTAMATAAEVAAEQIAGDTGQAERYLEDVAQGLRRNGLDVETRVLQGKEGGAIVEYAHRSGIDLIAIATHGRSGLGRAVFGSVADYVLRESGLPVLVVRPHEGEGTHRDQKGGRAT